jgi:hypothetical protein
MMCKDVGILGKGEVLGGSLYFSPKMQVLVTPLDLKKKMKKTIYFNSQQNAPNLQTHQIQEVINAVTSLRDVFLAEISESIARIDSEQIHFVTWNNGTYLIAVIQLSYYEK